jgi:arylsulfatase A-like enzyme
MPTIPLISLLLGMLPFLTSQETPTPPNILFIAVDDLRPELGIYGNPVIHTPAMDQLAQEGVYFTRHFVQVPTCGASRYSLMTGQRPTRPIHLDNSVFYKEVAPAPETHHPESFVHELKRNGYTTVGVGKISHSADGYVYGYEEEPSQIKEMPHSWDRFLFDPGKWQTGWNAFFAYANGENRQSLGKQVPPYEMGTVDDQGYPDGLTLLTAIDQLHQLKNNNQPFFLGVGFFKPHLPFNAPKKYWDLYVRDSLPLPKDPFIPKNVDVASLGSMGEFYSYQLSDEKPTYDQPVSDAYARKLIHGYYASVSYVDHLIGQLLEKLKELDLDQNTIVIIWGDHGWHLGNDRKWGKHTLFERALRSTLLMKIPGVQPASHEITDIVESVDLYPTLLDLCGMPLPNHLDGESLLPLLKGDTQPSDGTAFSYWYNGLSLRTDRYRLTKFFRNGQTTFELYDHLSDPDENINVADSLSEVVNALLPVLESHQPGFYKN